MLILKAILNQHIITGLTNLNSNMLILKAVDIGVLIKEKVNLNSNMLILKVILNPALRISSVVSFKFQYANT